MLALVLLASQVASSFNYNFDVFCFLKNIKIKSVRTKSGRGSRKVTISKCVSSLIIVSKGMATDRQWQK